MITLSKTLDIASWCLAALVMAPAAAQTQTAPATTKTASAPPWHQKTIRFSDEKVILGLPRENSRVPHCSGNGTTFVDLYAGSSSDSPELFSVSPAGEVANLHRMLPPDFTSVSVRDFFAADHTLVTLLEAVKRDADSSAPPDIHYLLSLSDHDGGNAKLLPLELRFKPLKVALFGSGDFLVLGWDEANLLPTLALLKEDGTVRRFIDLEDRRHLELYTSYASLKEAESSTQARAAFASLQRAQFVPYGSEVLLAYPGTAKSVSVLSAVGEDRSIPIELPGGFVLHDVLVSSAGYPLILRAQPMEVPGRPATASEAASPQQRLFEMSSHNGSLLREFLFDKPHIDAVTCAPASTLTAIFYDTVADPVRPAGASGDQTAAAESATQLVIATAPR